MENKIESFIIEDESIVQKTIKTGISFGSAYSCRWNRKPSRLGGQAVTDIKSPALCRG